MKLNMGSVDRIVRIVLAVLFAYLYFGGIVTGAVGVILLVLAVVFLITSIVGFCPLYTLLKVSTRKE